MNTDDTDTDQLTEAEFDHLLAAVMDAITPPMMIMTLASGNDQLINRAGEFIEQVALDAIRTVGEEMTAVAESRAHRT